MARKPATSSQPNLTRRQSSRAKREARLQRMIIIGAIAFAIIVIGVIAYGFIDQQYLKPNRVLASAGDLKITGSQFTNHVKVNHYTQFGGVIPLSYYGLTAQSYSKLTLDSLIDDMVVQLKAREKGITVTNEDVQSQLELAFGYDAGTPEPTATPTATQIPESGSPTATATFVYTLTPSPTPTLDPSVTPTLTATITPTLAGTPTATIVPTVTPTPSPEPTATPVTEEGFKTNLNEYLKQVSDATGLTQEQVKVILQERVKATIYRKRLLEELDIPTDKEKTMIHAAHMLFQTEEEAKKALDKVKGGDAFEKVAAELSIAKVDAYKGGDMGWFSPDKQPSSTGDIDLDKAALNVKPGTISDPIKTLFGWSLLKVYESVVQPTTADEQELQRQQKFSEMLNSWRDELKIATDESWVEFVPDIQ